MNAASARALLHSAAASLPDAAVILVARLLALGEPGSDAVLGPVLVDHDTDPGGVRAIRERVGSEVRVVAAEVWRVLGRGGP